jgi:hypothetical protein
VAQGTAGFDECLESRQVLEARQFWARTTVTAAVAGEQHGERADCREAGRGKPQCRGEGAVDGEVVVLSRNLVRNVEATVSRESTAASGTPPQEM